MEIPADGIVSSFRTPDSVFKKKPDLAERHKLEKEPSKDIIATFDHLYQKHVKEADPAKKKKYSDDIRLLIRENRKDIRAVAKAYVHGNSALRAGWRLLLDLQLKDFMFPVWLFKTVLVESGSVLELDGGYNILTGDTLVIEEGGTVRSRRQLNIDFSNLRRTL